MDRIRRGANNGQMVKVSAKTLNNLTPERRDVLEAEVESGQIRSGTWQVASTDRIAKSGSTNTPVGAIVHSHQYVNKMVKTANPVTGGTTNVGSGLPGGGSVERMAPEVYSPLYTMANLNLPRDPITVNAWVRNMYLLHPIVRNVINLHATYPISKINLKCHDTKVLRFFEDMAEEMDLMGSVGDVALEWWKHGECVSGEVLATTSHGLKRMDQIKIGDKVLTHSGKYKKVIDRLINYNHDEILNIKFRNLTIPLPISKNHPVFCVNHKKGERLKSVTKNKIIYYKDESQFNWNWKKAGDLVPGDICLIPVDRKVKDNKEITSEWCRLFGIWLSEGSFSKKRRSDELDAPIVTNYDDNLWKDYDVIFSNCNFRMKKYGEGNGCLRSLTPKTKSTKSYAQYIQFHCGEYCDQKVLSEEIMHLPPQKQLEIVNGFVDGDGWIHRGRICMGTTSIKLAFQIRQILARNFVLCSINPDKNNRNKELYTIEIPLYYAKFFNLYSTKQNELNKYFSKKLKPNHIPRQRFSKDGHIITQVEKIKIKKNNDPLYNLEVEDDNSYCVYGIAVHNCFPYAELDESSGKWKKIIIQNPDYIRIKKSVLSGEPVISLRADETLQRLVFSNNPAEVQIRSQIPENILYYIRAGQPIPLDNFNVSHLKMTASPYDLRGTSIIVSVFKDIMRYDKIMECKFAQADGMINPITVIKVGGNADGDYRATQEDIEYYRQLFEEAQFDKDFKLITHAGITVERIGYSGQIIDESQDLAFIVKNIYTGLMIPPAVVDTEGSVYNSASIGLEVLRQRYFNFRNMMARWLTNKIFAPISEINDFYEFKDGVKKLIVPEIEYNHMNLYDLQDYITNITGLAQNKQVSLQTLYRSLGLNYEEERIKIRQEIINETIREKEVENLKKMSITELRALDPEKEISELVTTKETEENTSAEIPGGGVPELGAGLSLSPTEAPTGGLGGGGLGTMQTPEAPPPGGPGASGGGEMPPI